MSPAKKRLLVPHSLADAGWAIIRGRDDIEGILFDDEEPPSSLHGALREADGIALGHTLFSAAEIEVAQHLCVVGRIGVGFDSVDVAELTRRRIPLMVTSTSNSVSVAEHTVAFMMMLAKKMIAMDTMVQEGRWHERLHLGPMDLYQRTVLIIGFGRIGVRTASRCVALEMNVLIYDPQATADAVKTAGCAQVDDLDAALPLADFVCILCPKTKETTNLFDAARMARMKSTAFLINTARGGMIDEATLYGALKSGKLGGAALDVFEHEPVPSDHPLLALPNFIASPHLAGITREAAARMAEVTINNILSVFDGNPNLDLMLNKEVLG